MPIPEEIKKLKPEEYGAVEIRFLNNRYYVYTISSVWDSEKKRAKKVTGKCIGKITEHDGFIPNQHGLGILPLYPKVMSYGAYEILSQLSGDLENNLRAIFPDIYREICIVARLTLINGGKAKNIARYYQNSSLKELYPDCGISENTANTLAKKIGMRPGDVDAFLNQYSSDVAGHKLLFDGTHIFTRADDSDHSKNPQIRLLYIFDKDTYMPIFYRMIPGNIVDKKAFIETQCSNSVIIADKGFYSKPNVSFLMEHKLKFILPLQSNTSMISKEFDEDETDKKFDGAFTYKKRVVKYKVNECGDKGNYIYIFRDEKRKMDAEYRYLERLAADVDVSEEENVNRRGVFAFCSNIQDSAENIYLSYKERWDIEQCFDYMKNNVVTSASYKRSNEELAGWSFLNHISLLYFYGLIRAIRNSDLRGDITPEDVLDIGRNIYRVKDYFYDKKARISELTDNDGKILKALGVDILRNLEVVRYFV